MQISDNLRSVILMNVAMATFTINDVFMKIAMQSIGFAQAVTMRGLLCSVMLLALAWHYGALTRRYSRKDQIYIGLRSLADLGATVSFLGALQYMPLGNLSAIAQFTPLAVTLAAAVFFAETIGWRRILAILVGFIGVLIILRPGTDGFDHWSILGLISVLCVVARDLVTRKVSRDVSSIYVALIGSVAVLLMGAVAMIPSGWTPVTAGDLAAITMAACSVIFAYLTIVGTMRFGAVGAVAPFRYMSLLWAVVLGWFILGEVPDPMVLLGAALVVGSGIFSLMRERVVKQG